MNEQKKKPIIGIGTTSIVLIFVMLCMLTFSVLSLATAQADLRLSRKSAERTTAYYDAENRAHICLPLQRQPQTPSGKLLRALFMQRFAEIWKERTESVSRTIRI